MSRFDGARQGALVWIIGLLVTIVAAVLGWVFGDKYNVLDRVNLPRLPISAGRAGTGGVIAVVAMLVVTLLAAVLGGKIGNHYHTRVDKAARSADLGRPGADPGATAPRSPTAREGPTISVGPSRAVRGGAGS